MDSKMITELYDYDTGITRKVVINSVRGAGISIHVEGYGENTTLDESGEPILIDFMNDNLRIHVWGDINNQEPTEQISLEGARLEKRMENA